MEWITNNKQKLQWASFLLVILAFPLLTIGVNDGDAFAWIGMAMVVLGFAIPPLVRLLGKKSDGDKKGGDGRSSAAGPDEEAERKRTESRGQQRPEGGG